MKAKMDMASKEGFCLIEATVVTGFESVAKDEVQERFGTACKELRGKIQFQCPVSVVEQVSVIHFRDTILAPSNSYASDF